MKSNGKVGRIALKQVHFAVITTARDGVDELDRTRREKGLSQMDISHMAEMPDEGMQYCRMYKSGDIKISKFLRFLKALGCNLVIMKED